MRKIIIHNPCNENTRYFRFYNLFWDDLTIELKKKYIVTENRYFEYADRERFKVNLKKQTSHIDNFLLLECEYVIEFEDTGEFYVLSVSDNLTHAIINEKDNPYLKKVLVSQFDRNQIKNHVGNNSDIYSPWIYFPSTIDDLESFYIKRKKIDKFVDKIYFRGTSILDRPIVTHFDESILTGYNPIGSPKTYFEELITHKIGLSIAGRGELCYRDIEYMALGIPFIRFEYITELNPKLIPNYHYISVDRPSDLYYDRLGNKEHAQLLEAKFYEVKDNPDYLLYIAKNARDYYEKYLMRGNNIKHTLELLNL